MTTRPTVTIATAEGKASGETYPLPAVFRSPIRPDIVQYGSEEVIEEVPKLIDVLGAFTLEWQRTRDSHML